MGNLALFFLVFFRILAMVQVAPLLSSGAIPQLAKIGLSLLTSITIFPSVVEMGYPIPDTFLHYALLLLGEILVGIILGLILVIIYASFQVAGQFFSLQMGFAASQVFDPLAQIQIPLMGQFLNLIAMFVFISVGGLTKFFLVGVMRSFHAMTAVKIVAARVYLMDVFLRSIGRLFEIALVIAFPVMGILLIVSITMGLLAKAAPQMNLLMMGFPIAIGVAFFVLFLAMPYLMHAMGKFIDWSFQYLLEILTVLRGGG